MFSPEARPALATETKGQAAYTYKYGDFPPQKAAILPEHLQVRPEDIEQSNAVKTPTEKQLEEHEASGGSTYSPQRENLAGKNLYSVAEHPDRTLSMPQLTPEVLEKFKSDNADLLSKGDRAVGTWKDPDTGETVLDITKLHGDRDQAIAAGEAANQKGIYHLGGEGYIPTGGTGEGPKVEQRNAAKTPAYPENPEGFEHIHPKLLDLMEPDEKEFVKGDKRAQTAIQKSYDGIKPTIDEAKAAIQAGGAVGGWWQRFIDTFQALGEPTEATKIEQLGPAHAEALKAWHSAVSGNKSVEDANRTAVGHVRRLARRGSSEGPRDYQQDRGGERKAEGQCCDL